MLPHDLCLILLDETKQKFLEYKIGDLCFFKLLNSKLFLTRLSDIGWDTTYMINIISRQKGCMPILMQNSVLPS